MQPGAVVGQISDLWRYPVKSMSGQLRLSVEAGDQGFVGDRAFGVVSENGLLLSAKRTPLLLEAAATFRDDGEVSIQLPNGFSVASDHADCDETLSAWLEQPVRLVRPETGKRSSIEIDLLDDPNVYTFHTRPGLFHDGSVMHLLTNASLEAARALYPAGDWQAPRFRPNVLIDAAGAAGFVEDDWVGWVLDVSGMRVHVHKACDRCVLVTQPVGKAGRDRQILRVLTASHQGNLGVKAHVVGAGVVRIGDPVTVVGRAADLGLEP